MRRYASTRGSIKEFFGTACLEGCYDFDVVATDKSGNGINGALSGGGTSSTGGLIAGNARRFNGTNDYISLGNNFSFERTDSFSVILWIWLDSIGVSQGLISKLSTGGSGYRGWEVTVPSANVIQFMLSHNAPGADRFYIRTSTQILANKIYCIGITYDGSSDANGARVYVNGIKDSVTIYDNSLTATIINSDECVFGCRSGGSDPNNLYLDGVMDEVGVFSRELSSREMQEYYAWSTDTSVRKRMFVPFTPTTKYVPRREALVMADDDLIINATDGLNKPTEDALRRAAFWSGH